MSIPLNFLSASNGVPLAKSFSQAGVTPYPLVKHMNSHTFYIAPGLPGMQEALGLFQKYSAEGAAFLKGNLRKPLENESRAGQVDKFALTQLLVIDIDGLPMYDLPEGALNATIFRRLVEKVMAKLPAFLQQTTCIAHAASSLGMVEGRMSVHLIFQLTRPVGPDGLKEWIIAQNLSNELFAQHLTLSPQNTTLHYVLDPVLANNTHLLFIAPPQVSDDLTPAFPDPDERWVLIEGAQHTVDLLPEISTVCPQQNAQAREKLLNELRKEKGLRKFTPKMRTMTGFMGDKVSVLSNPDAMAIEFSHENEQFVYFNVNGGDSHAYYCPKHNPDIIYNFKNEPPFELSRANPAVYEWYCEKYADVIRERSETLSYVIRDFTTDNHYALDVNPSEDRVERLAQIQKANVGDWLAEKGKSTPDPIPTWDIRFDPESDVVVDEIKKSLNLYRRTDFMRKAPEILPQYHVELGGAKDTMATLCPIVYKIIHHMCGSADMEFEYFINWLAACIQTRRKMGTAWLFSGVPGTGKGLFYEYILRPLIGEEFTQRKRIDHLDDKFNGYLEQSLFLVYDEFRLSDSRTDGRALNHLKDEITAETGTIRAMHAEGVTRRLYTNYMFFSNHHDAIRIEDGDRRFNVAPSQNRKLVNAHPEIEKQVSHIIDELPQFAAFIQNYRYSEHYARTCLENRAKVRMKEAAMGWHEQFCLALRQGTLDYFLDDLTEDFSHENAGAVMTQQSARKIVLHWVRDAIAGEPTHATVAHLHTVYNALAPNLTTPKKFATMLGRNDVYIDRLAVGGRRERAVLVYFKSAHWTVEELAELLSDNQPHTREFKPCQPPLH